MNVQAQYKDLWNQAKQKVSTIQLQQPQYVRKQEAIIPKQNIKLNFQKSSIEHFIQRLPNKSKIKQIQKTNIPKSIYLLDYYCQKSGYQPMGSITDRIGSRYIGRIKQKDQQGKVYYKQFPQIKSKQLNSVDLFANLNSYASDAIIKWNQFSQAEAKLGNYVQKISSKQGRQKLMKLYANLSSYGTRILKMLSSLAALYLNQRSNDIDFLQLGDTVSINHLQNILKGQGNIMDIGNQVFNFCNLNASPQKMQFLKSFILQPIHQLKSQLSQQLYQQIREKVQSRTVYIPPQMIIQPTFKTPQWYKYLKQDNNNEIQLLVLTRWSYQNSKIKFINYF